MSLGDKDIFWVTEIRDIISNTKMSKSDTQRVNRLCDCYEKIYSLIQENNQKSMLTKYLNWFHDTFKDEEYR